MHYNLEVLKGDEIILAQRLVLTGMGDVWSTIARMAEDVAETGCRIRVTDEAGGIAILIGLTAARRLFQRSAHRLNSWSSSLRDK